MNNLKDCIQLMRTIDSYNLEFLSSGNLSIRLGNGNIAIKPSGVSYKSVNKNNISILDKNGMLLHGLKPSSDFKAHITIYSGREDINCIVHTHSHFATIFAILGKPIEVLSTMHADYFGRKIPCLQFINHRSGDFGKQVLNIKCPAVLLEKHGALIFSDSIEKVAKYTIILEEIARLNYHALLLSPRKKLKSLLSKDIKILHTFYNSEYL